MTEPLVLCPACSRHIRSSERVCPFCATAQPATGVALADLASPTFARVAAIALVASVAMSSAGCIEVANAQPHPPPAIPGPVPMYGVVPMPRDAGVTPPSPGQPVVDAGHHDAATHRHDSGARPRDAGVVRRPPSDPGAVRPLYGDPPPPGNLRQRPSS